jgi:hypothetical protein
MSRMALVSAGRFFSSPLMMPSTSAIFASSNPWNLQPLTFRHTTWSWPALELQSGGTFRRDVLNGHFGTQGQVQMATPTITISGSGELTVRLETNWPGSTFRAAGLKVARVHAQQTSTEARLITGYLADPTAPPPFLLRSGRA